MKVTQQNVARYYKDMQITTAHWPKQLIMLHDRCVEMLKSAIQQAKTQEDLLSKAITIIAHLAVSLKREDTASYGIYYLYEYSIVQIQSMNPQQILYAIEVMESIRDSLRALLKKMD